MGALLTYKLFSSLRTSAKVHQIGGFGTYFGQRFSFKKLAFAVSERIKIKLSNLGLVKKDKQLDEGKLCSFFAKPQKQIGRVHFVRAKGSDKTLKMNRLLI
jgi:hypothetical protein